MTTSVPVSLGDRSYLIHIGEGLIENAGVILAPLLGSSPVRRVPVVSDENVAKLYYPSLASSLSNAGLSPVPIVLTAGEQTKSFNHLERLVDSLLAANVERGSLVVALGGGVIGDLVGFAAGVVKRGIGFAQIPTTLLAQVDSSVGGKTAINTSHGKNLVGLFHQPRVVVADTAVLKTLPRRELLSGYAEVVKYGLLGDETFFSWLEKNGSLVLDGEARAVAHAIAHSCVMKASIVARDEREEGERALLNLGHTFGHALEAATGYSDRLLHGESVGLGCVLALKLSVALGHARQEDVTRTIRHLSSAGLPTRIAQIPGAQLGTDEILGHMRHDKKAQAGRLTFILANGIGHAFIAREVPEEKVRAVLDED